ncbi:velvet factor [Catenaria anguillulae PL171]|uniref:Velvet factor n=1 Tax=Catenaria anguillulae PL171 TaxID=765915 RepID=A0A1Y2I0K7_9FUNG|nr:velvet factor [Catenaria anguillulae PL171]
MLSFHFGPIYQPPPIIPASSYELVVLQQPQRCRVCGVTEKDRRPIDPPIIVQAIAKDAYGNVLSEPQDWHMLVMHAALYTDDGMTECTIMRSIRDLTRSKAARPAVSGPPQAANVTIMPALDSVTPAMPQQQAFPNLNATAPTVTMSHPFPFTIPTNPYTHPPLPATSAAAGSSSGPAQQQPQESYMIHSALDLVGVAGAVRVLMGSLVASCHRVMGMDGETGLFFAFQDISLRYEGNFRLQFRLFNLADVADADGEDGGGEGGEAEQDELASAPVLATVMTDVFTAYSAKKFPGMLESTEVSKHFANQGIKLPTRSEPRRGQAKRRAKTRNEDEGGPGGDEDAGDGGNE